MKYIAEELYQAYFDALDGEIEQDGAEVPIYTIVPPSASLPYIHLNDVSSIENGTKDVFIHEATVIIDIYTNDRTKLVMTEITNDLITIIKANRGSVLSLDNFNMISLEVVGMQTTEYLDDNKQFHVIQNTIRINHLIEES